MTKSSPSIWHLLHNIKSTVKISSIFYGLLRKHELYQKLRFVSNTFWTKVPKSSHCVKSSRTLITVLEKKLHKKERKSYVMKVSCQVHKPIVVCLVFLGISQQFCKTGHNWSNGPFSEVGSIWYTVRTVLSNLPNFLEFTI